MEEQERTTETNEESTVEQEITVEVIRTSYPDVYEAIFNEGVEAERSRLQELDNISNASRADVINRAKYETFAFATDVALELLQAEPVNPMQARLDDAEASNGLHITPAYESSKQDQEEKKIFNTIDAVMNRRLKSKEGM